MISGQKPSDAAPGGHDDVAREVELRASLSRAREAIAAIPPVLAHLVAQEPAALLNEAVIACTRGMVESLAMQLVRATRDEQPAGAGADRLAARLAGLSGLVGHCHALAVEAQCADRIHAAGGPDPLLSPLLQECIGAADAETAATAMTLLAAQARFTLALRRMELPLHELPADLLHGVLAALAASDLPGGAEAAQHVRQAYAEGRSRTALLGRVSLMLAGGPKEALRPDRAGLALFLSGLALVTGIQRESAALALAEGQEVRLATLLLAAGLDPRGAEAALLCIHPDRVWPAELGGLDSASARSLLAQEIRR